MLDGRWVSAQPERVRDRQKQKESVGADDTGALPPINRSRKEIHTMGTVAEVTVAVKAQVATGNDLAHAWGHEDATEGHDQRGGAYFPIGSAAWHSYNEGYRTGCLLAAALTGQSRTYWVPVMGAVSWNSGVQA